MDKVKPLNDYVWHSMPIRTVNCKLIRAVLSKVVTFSTSDDGVNT